MTTEEQLAQVEEAIAAIINGAQEYRTGDLTVKRADLATLYTRQKELTAQINYENSSGGISLAEFDRR